MKKCTAVWRETHFEVKMYKTPGVRTTFGGSDVEKVHTVVARSTCRSQNVQNTPFSDHFWETSKKCTPLWREARFEVKMYKTPGVRTTFGGSDVEKVHTVVARSTFRSQNVKNTRGSDHFWRFRCRFARQAQGIVHLVKSEKNVRVLWHFQLQPPLHHTTLQYIRLHYNYNYLHYILLHSTPLHYTAFNYTQLHYTTLHYTPFHYTSLHYTTLHYLPLHFTTLHHTTLHNTTTTTTQLHSTTLNYTPLH